MGVPMLSRMIVGTAALAFLAYSVGLAAVSAVFPDPGKAAASDHVILFVVATVAAAMLHVGACLVAHKQPPRLFLVLAVAIGARLVLLFGGPGPILEGDLERQRFDARLVNQAISPYEFRPTHLAGDSSETLAWPQAKQERLSQARARMSSSEDAPIAGELRRPDLRTAALPLQLWISSVADRFKPASSRGLAFLALVADVIAIFFLILALRALGKPAGWVMVYAWSPVLLHGIYCTLPVDAFLMPVLAALVYCLASGRRLLTAVPVALGAGLQLPLLLLVPVLGRRLGVLGVLLVAILFVGPFLPFWADSTPTGAFFETQVHVWRHFEYNSILENPLRKAFSFLPGAAENTLSVAGVELARPGEKLYVLLVKVLLGVCLLGLATYLAIRAGDGEEAMSFRRDGRATFAILAALLLVSPVLHPMTAVWILPFIAVRPCGLSWLALPAIVCLSYLTHLAGPDAADLTFAGGLLSYRVFGYSLFGVLLFLDWRLRDRLFPDGNASAESHNRQQSSDDAWGYELPEAEPLAY